MTRHLPLTLIILCAALITACAPRSGTGEITPTAETDLVIDLPAIIIDIDSGGNASIDGFPLEALTIPPAQIRQLTARNIQHIQFNNRQHGLDLWINGRSMPSARWDRDTLSNLATTLDLLGLSDSLPQMAQFLPLTQQIGTAIIVRFPQQDGTAVIPLDNGGPNSAGATAQQTRDTFLASVGRSPTIRIPVTYDDSGSWRVNNITENEYMVLLPGFPWNALHLRQDAIASLKANDITQLEITTDPQGLHLSLNRQILPHIGWSNGELHNLIQLLDETGLLAENGIALPQEQQQILIDIILPIIQASDFQLTVNFPE